MKNKEKTEIVIPSGYSLDELLDWMAIYGTKNQSA